MNALIVGAGAIGSWLAVEFAQAGVQATLVARPRQLEALREGVYYHDQFRLRPQVLTSVAEAQSQEWETIVLTVKAFQVEAAAREILDAELTFDRLWSLQNGVGSDDFLLEQFGPDRLLAAATTRAVGCPQIGRLEPSNKGGLSLAPFGRDWVDRDRPRWHRDLSTGILYMPDALQMKWSKLLLNMIANASCAITGLMPAELARDGELFGLEIEAFREALRVMKAMGYRPLDLPDFPVRRFTTVASRLPRAWSQKILGPVIGKARGGKTPSLLGDLLASRGNSEVLYLNGAVAQEAARRKVHAPVQATLFELAQGLMEGRLDREEFHREPKRLLAEVERRRSQKMPPHG